MFKTWKENQRLKEQMKVQALENTALIKENEKLKIKLHQIETEINKFDFINGNAFSLINKIKETIPATKQE
jgi:regulator of replication initiation timing